MLNPAATEHQDLDMEFLLYLTPESSQILDLIRQAEVRISENTARCREKNIFGFADSGRRLAICTKNIKSSGLDIGFYINETLMHESVHIAQQCRGGPFWLDKVMMPLPWNKLNDVKRSTNVSNISNGNQVEHEAYWMEDKPNEVKYVLKKYCL